MTSSENASPGGAGESKTTAGAALTRLGGALTLRRRRAARVEGQADGQDGAAEQPAPQTLDEALEQAKRALEAVGMGPSRERGVGAKALQERLRAAVAKTEAPRAREGGSPARRRALKRPPMLRVVEAPSVVEEIGPGVRLASLIQSSLGEALAGEPLEIVPSFETVLAFRVTVSVWASAPRADTPASPEATASVVEKAEALARSDPWRLLGARQGVLEVGEGVRGATSLHLDHRRAADADKEDQRTALALALAHYSEIAARRGFVPRLVGLERHPGGARVLFEAEAPAAMADVAVGARTSRNRLLGGGARAGRTRARIAGVGAPMTLFGGERLVDATVERALDAAPFGQEGMADSLASVGAGRRALAAAASIEPRARYLESADAHAPWLSPECAARLYDLAERCQGAVGRSAVRRLWPMAGLAAPALGVAAALGLAFSSSAGVGLGAGAAQGFMSAIAGLFGLSLPAPLSMERSAAVGLLALAPFALLWVGALGGVARAYRGRTRQAFGAGRALSLQGLMGFGATPWAALAVGLVLYSASFFGLSAAMGGLKPPVERVSSAPAAQAWALEGETATVLDSAGEARLSLGCEAGALRATLAGAGALDAAWATLRIDGVAAPSMLVDARGGFTPSRRALSAMRRGAEARLLMLDAAGQPVTERAFTLEGSGAALAGALRGCGG